VIESQYGPVPASPVPDLVHKKGLMKEAYLPVSPFF
jgi:hypothetical protein